MNVLFVLLGCFFRWVTSYRPVASRIFSRYYVAFLRCSHLAFYSCVLLESRRWIPTVVVTQLRLGGNSIWFSLRLAYVYIIFNRWDIAAKVCKLVNKFQSGDGFILFQKYGLGFICHHVEPNACSCLLQSIK